MPTEAIILIVAAFWILHRVVDYHRTPKEVRQTRRRARELRRRETALVDGLLLEMDQDQINSDDTEPIFSPTYLVYEFTPENGTEGKIESRHYISNARAAKPDLVMKVGKGARVRYVVDDPSVSVLEDF